MPIPTRNCEHRPAGAANQAEWSGRHLFSHLEASATATPGGAAFRYRDQRISYSEAHRAVLSLAGYLQQHLSVERGDRVLLLMEDCPHFVIAWYAIQRCEAVVVAISPASSAEEIARYAEDSGSRVLITTREMLGKAGALLDSGSLAGCIVGAGNESPAVVGGGRNASRDDRFRTEIHEFSGALAAGIAPTPMRGGCEPSAIGYADGARVATGEVPQMIERLLDALGSE
ncbi:AMP-binding protein [Pseudomonas schmalbachii]|uniref:AMP-binding protein n=1 Tax=Pseudomonas schmalbachii TaxID=2816993 RepID=A0ABS3TJG9_9PSED|nr:AMP-binding protein [Pseudomonas schmalbachii]MBO3273807.1 AMP-binding protein [Pseudomonas schmalbachii]